MSGYVASARIDRGSARLVAAWDPPVARVEEDRSVTVAWIEASPEELGPGGLSLRWAAFRERWAQLTFFLFDPSSWR